MFLPANSIISRDLLQREMESRPDSFFILYALALLERLSTFIINV